MKLETCGDEPRIVETVPGWTHDITNIGEDEMVVMLWANEIFDREKPDDLCNAINPLKSKSCEKIKINDGGGHTP